jgi:hypothetical protein
MQVRLRQGGFDGGHCRRSAGLAHADAIYRSLEEHRREHAR